MRSENLQAFFYSILFSLATATLLSLINLSITYRKQPSINPIKITLVKLPTKEATPKPPPKKEVPTRKNPKMASSKLPHKTKVPSVPKPPQESPIKDKETVKEEPKESREVFAERQEPSKEEAKESKAVSGAKADMGQNVSESTQKPTVPKSKTEEKPSLDALSLYLSKVKSIIDSRKRYPEEAKRFGVEGEVVLRISVSENGKITRIELLSSSGSRLLDRDAQELIRSIGSFPPPPGGKSMSFNVSINYKLEE